MLSGGALASQYDCVDCLILKCEIEHNIKMITSILENDDTLRMYDLFKLMGKLDAYKEMQEIILEH